VHQMWCCRRVLLPYMTSAATLQALRGVHSGLALSEYRTCHLLPVAAYRGAAHMSPSGMLCSPIANTMMGAMSVNAEKATANPSGRLCSVCSSSRACHARSQRSARHSMWSGGKPDDVGKSGNCKPLWEVVQRLQGHQACRHD
jgi:hypothetical protein